LVDLQQNEPFPPWKLWFAGSTPIKKWVLMGKQCARCSSFYHKCFSL
jgi:hypothetical protein